MQQHIKPHKEPSKDTLHVSASTVQKEGAHAHGPDVISQLCHILSLRGQECECFVNNALLCHVWKKEFIC